MASKLSKSKKNTLWKHWLEVETKITEEIQWLRSVIAIFSDTEQITSMGCRECFLRKLAFLIVSGKIKATEITKSPLLKSLWISKRGRKRRKKIHHGGEWHRETMEKIESHFLALGFEVTREPNLAHGRADLGVFKEGEQDLYVEVGTITSFYKLLLNMKAMKNFVYLLVPSDGRLIEFKASTPHFPIHVTNKRLRDVHRQFHSGKNLK